MSVTEVQSKYPRQYVYSLDGLRAIAIIAVVAIHAGVPGAGFGWLGVDLFLTLSGFLITTLLLEEHRKTKEINLLNFWGRRMLRLLPAYYLYIVLLCLFILLGKYSISAVGSWSPEQYIASLWLYFNNFLPRGGFWRFDLLSIHLWSLALEEQFYVIWPVLLVIAIKLKERFRFPLITIPLIIFSIIFFLRPLWDDLSISSLLNGRGLAILLGSIVSIYIHEFIENNGSTPAWLSSSFLRKCCVISIGIIVISLSIIQSSNLITEDSIRRWFIPLIALQFSLLISMLWYNRQEDKLTSPLRWQPLVYIGRISYGIYLYHMLAHFLTWEVLLHDISDWPSFPKFGLRLIVYGVLSVGLAALSFHVYERVFLLLKDKLR